jgi:hypothetical protein
MFEQATKDLSAFGDALRTSLGGAAKESESSLQRMEDSAHGAAVEFGKAGEEAGTNFAKGLAVSFGLAAAEFINTMRSTIESASGYASDLLTTQMISGDSIPDLQKFEFAMRSVSIDSERTNMLLTALQQRIVIAAEKAKDTSSVFYQLGLNAKNMVGKDAITNIETVADKLANLKNTTERTRVAGELFGERIADAMMPLLEQGGDGIKHLMEIASQFGGQISTDLILKLADLDTAWTRLEQSTRAFYVTLAGPLIPLLTDLANATMHFYAWVEALSKQQQLTALFAAMTVALFGLEEGLTAIGTFFARGFAMRAIIDIFKEFSLELQVIGLVATALFVAFETNFAGMKKSAGPTLQAIGIFFQNLVDTIGFVGHEFRTVLVPAINEVGESLAPLVDQGSDFLTNFLAGDWRGVRTLIDDLAHALANLLKNGIKPLIDNGIKPLLNEIGALPGQLRDANPLVVAFGLALSAYVVPPLLTIAGSAFVAALTKLLEFVESVAGVAGAIRIATVAASDFVLPIIIIAGLIDLISRNFYALQSVVLKVEGAFQLAWARMILPIGDALRAVSDLFDKLGQLVGIVPSLGGVSAVMDGIAIVTRKAADAAYDWYQNLVMGAAAREEGSKTASNLSKGHGASWKPGGRENEYEAETPYINAVMAPPAKKPPDDTPKHGDQSLTPPAGTDSAAMKAAADLIDQLAEKVKLLKFALDDAKGSVTLIEDQMKALGTIDTPQKLATQQHLLRGEMSGTLTEMRDTNAITMQLQSNADVLYAKWKGASDPELAKKFRDAWFGVRGEIKQNEIAAQALGIRYEDIYHTLQSSAEKFDEALLKNVKTYNEQLVILQDELQQAKARNATASELADIEDRILKIRKDQTDAAVSLAAAQRKEQSSIIQGQMDVRDAQAKTTNQTPQQDADREVLDAQAKAAKAAIALADAEAKANAASVELTRQKKNEYGSEADLNAAEIANQQAINELTDADYKNKVAILEVIAAQNRLKNEALQKTSDAFDKLGTEIAGPLYTSVKLLTQANQTGAQVTAGLVGVFIELFQQSNAFKDVQAAFKAIIENIAQIFDAMRPVLDFLLGILIGVLNVFFELYNILATLLNLFGLNIQKLKLLNDWLDTTTSKPLIDVTHDIPTISEYDSGKWGDLIAQNTGNIDNSLEQGFNAQLAKLGEIIGVLIGIKLVLGLILGQSLSKQVGGIFSGIGNFFSSLFGNPDGSGTSIIPIGDDGGPGALPPTAPIGLPTVPGVGDSYTPPPFDPSQVPGLTDSINNLTDATNNAAVISAQNGEALTANTSAVQGGAGTSGGGLTGATSNLGTIMGVAAGAMQIFAGLSPGGNFSETLGGLGMILGTTLGGPLAPILGPLADAVGSLIGSFFGPQVNAQNNPDMFEGQTGYGQDIANMLGSAGADGTTYKESGALTNLFGGGGMLSVIEKYLASPNASSVLGGTLFNSLVKMFGESSTGSGSLYWPFKNISYQMVTGASGTSGAAYTYADFQNGIKQFVQALEYSSQVVSNLFSDTVDVATLYGRQGGIVSGPTGGANAQAQQTPTVNLTIGEIHGVRDTDDFKAQVAPIVSSVLDEWARKQQTYTRNNGFVSGRYS